ncbi:hypothetical protein VULLAG_LOCUS19745 [Vulpes lagopus]
MVPPWALPASAARLQLQNGGRPRGASAGCSARGPLSRPRLCSPWSLDSTRSWEGRCTALEEGWRDL